VRPRRPHGRRLRASPRVDARIICVRKAEPKEIRIYEKKYGFSKGKRGAALPSEGKTRIIIYLDDIVIERFKALSEKKRKGIPDLAE
jgi:hypothetical protein